ncbi:hypothetical protein CBR_g29779 [Chara braunii]|uniref:RING-type domain-containing protein n=1 Tax=Chara braunii TaxID=69332 RepID=A0A388LBD8_CHABU|nr:hypothetical protein CBR_g29779 [Chara braunii]|eukprot:GBG79629.1 hypothetical protein CBR_g29779 [Chara braunii]
MGVSTDLVVNRDRLPADIFCPICDDMIDQNDAMVTPCGHLFCGSCISTYVASRQQCPQDRSRVTTSQLLHIKTHSVFLYRLLGRSLVKCVNHVQGCTWQGEHSDSAAHLKTCGAVKVKCSRCGDESIFRRDYDHHRGRCGAPCSNCGVLSKENAKLRADLEAKTAQLSLAITRADKAEKACQSKSASSGSGSSSAPFISLDYRYTQVHAALVGRFIAYHSHSLPAHISRERLFTCVKYIADQFLRDPDMANKNDVRFLLAACSSADWFTANQHDRIEILLHCVHVR